MHPDILKKIKKCLALAGSSNPNEAEAALRQAQALMRLHNIDEADIRLSDVKPCYKKIAHRKAFPNYQQVLISKCAAAFECYVIACLDPRYEGHLKFIGTGSKPELALYAYDVLNRQLKKARANYLKTLTRVKKTATKTARADSYCEGWVVAAVKNIKGHGQDYGTGVIAEYIKQHHPELTAAKTIKRKESWDDAVKGLLDGRDAQFHPGVNPGGVAQKQLHGGS